jgi:hypothetical protein
MGKHSETLAFRVAETEAPAATLGFEYVVFRVQIGDDPLLVMLDLPGKYGEQDVEDHGLSSGVQA